MYFWPFIGAGPMSLHKNDWYDRRGAPWMNQTFDGPLDPNSTFMTHLGTGSFSATLGKWPLDDPNSTFSNV